MSEQSVATNPSIELQRARFAWDLEAGTLSFFGLHSVLFWSNPSLMLMLQPLAHEMGLPLFRLLLARNASIGTEEDYHAMVTALGSSFEEGFLAWGRAVSTAGWGVFELPHYDHTTRQATVRVRNPWELHMQAGNADSWGCPFLQGKLTGIFSHAFGTPCWAEEQIEANSTAPCVNFSIAPSSRTFEAELVQLRAQRGEREQRHLRQEINAKILELEQAQAERVRLQEEAIQAQARIIAELSTPLIPINNQVVLMPLVGQLDSQRAQRVLSTLLEGVGERRAACAILDISGLPIVDTQVASILIQAARAVALLGTEMILTGIRPEVAQTLVGLGLSLDGIFTCGTVQSGIALANERSRQRGR